MKTTREIKEFYTKKAKLYDLVLVKLFGYGKGLANFLEESDYLKPNLRILDAGCGSGALTKPLYNLSIEKNLENISFHGFDITPAMLDLFKKWINKNNAENIELVQADVLELEKLSKDWDNYDLIISSGMLEYLPKDKIRDGVSGLKKRLNKDGTFLTFITKDNIYMRFLIGKWWKSNVYGRKEFRHVFSDLGFKNISFKRFQSPYKYLNSWGIIIEARK